MLKRILPVFQYMSVAPLRPIENHEEQKSVAENVT
jgi:hypothetical protein